MVFSVSLFCIWFFGIIRLHADPKGLKPGAMLEETCNSRTPKLATACRGVMRFFVVETALHQNPKHLSISPPSRTAASASSQAGGESALEPLSTDKGRAGSQITQKKQSTTHRAARKPLKRLAIADAAAFPAGNPRCRCGFL